jgi:predicted aspartyl protease
LITGTVTKDGVPIVKIVVAGAQYPGIIDTGFNGDLELPDQLRSQVNARFICRAESLLAGGITVDDEVFLVEFGRIPLRWQAPSGARYVRQGCR